MVPVVSGKWYTAENVSADSVTVLLTNTEYGGWRVEDGVRAQRSYGLALPLIDVAIIRNSPISADQFEYG